VHRFSRPTMPLLNLFKNSAYYWAFAVGVAYPLCHPQYVKRARRDAVSRVLCTMSFVVSVVVMLLCCYRASVVVVRLSCNCRCCLIGLSWAGTQLPPP
jgi:hypothetical protein